MDNYFNINEKLDKLIEQYDINHNNEHLKRYDTFVKCMCELIDGISENKIIAIRGGGAHTHMLLSILGNRGERIKYIIDKKQVDIDEYRQTCILLNDIEKYDIDVILVSSYAHKGEMIEDLYFNYNIKSEVIDLYEYTAKNGGVIFLDVFYHEIPTTYSMIYETKRTYLFSKAGSDDDKRCMEILISQYINIRDIISAKEYITEYIEKGYDNENLYKAFLKDLDSLCLEIKERISNNTKKHIIVNWIDALNPDEVQYMPFLSKILKKGAVFENAYTYTPYTNYTMSVMHTGKRTIEDMLDAHLYLYINSSELIDWLRNNGYEYMYCGYYHIGRFTYYNKSATEYRIHRDNIFHHSVGASTIYQWNTLEYIINTDFPALIIIHNLDETHPPNMSGNMRIGMFKLNDSAGSDIVSIKDINSDIEGKNTDIGKQIDMARKYLDRQLEWYSQFFDNNIVKIYMSDHGKVFDIYKTTDKLLKTLFMISGNTIKSKKYSGFFSNINFVDVIDSIIKNNGFENCMRDYIISEHPEPYSKAMVIEVLEKYLSSKMSRKQLLCNLSYKVFRNNSERYVLYCTGDEEYYILPDEQNNLAYDKHYYERIAELRNIVGCEFIDVFKHDMFKESRMLYNAINIQRKDFIKLI